MPPRRLRLRDPDDTVLVAPPQASRPARGRAGWIGAAVVVALGLIGAGGYWALQAPASTPPVAAAEPIPSASETAIAAESPAVRTVLRFKERPGVVVIDFPTLAEQGRMFNRMAAWAEKAGVAHDRIPSEATLDAAIAASGATADTYYFGHDYSGDAVRHFFAEAAAQHVPLRPEEEDLQRIAARAEAEPAGFGAVISLVRADAATGLSSQARATILHHELSHGQYFTDPAYADFVASFWQNTLTAPERAAFRGYLAREGYDPALEDLMRNETQAYLMHTPDPAFFATERLGISPGRIAQLRAAFLAGMPPSWLRDALAASGIVPPQPRPRRRQRPARVSSGRTVTESVPPRRRRASPALRSSAR